MAMTDSNKDDLQAQLDNYVATYDRISAFLEHNTDATKQRMAIAHRKHVLDMMLTLRMAIKYPVENIA